MTLERPMLSLSTACLPHLPLVTFLRLATTSGFTGIELVLGPQTWLRPQVWLRPLPQIERLARDHGLHIYSVHQALAPFSLLQSGEQRMVAAAQAAVALGCPVVVIHGPWTSEWATPEGCAWLRALERCRAIVAGSQTRLSLENPGVYSHADHDNVLGSLVALLDLARDHDLDLTLDTCHVGTGTTDLLSAHAILRSRLSNVHLSDLRDGPGRHSPWTRAVWAHHQLPGAGSLPLDALLQRLRQDSYAGPVTLEASIFALRGWSLAQARQNLSVAAQSMGAALSGNLGAEPASQQPPLPAPSPGEGAT